MRKVVRNEEQIEYIVIGMFIGITIGFVVGLIFKEYIFYL
jgi:gas vesicle protein|tara:strand:+ start:13361 stop:13480 length:120 start_codon:yes stop_codon:yes gene_type:complete